MKYKRACLLLGTLFVFSCATGEAASSSITDLTSTTGESQTSTVSEQSSTTSSSDAVTTSSLDSSSSSQSESSSSESSSSSEASSSSSVESSSQESSSSSELSSQETSSSSESSSQESSSSSSSSEAPTSSSQESQSSSEYSSESSQSSESSSSSESSITSSESSSSSSEVHVHDPISESKESTCTETGYEKKVCSTCGEVLENNETPKKQHTPSDWIIDNDASCTTDGKKHKECTVCHTTLEEDAIAHGEHVAIKPLFRQITTAESLSDGDKLAFGYTNDKGKTYLLSRVAENDWGMPAETTVDGTNIEIDAVSDNYFTVETVQGGFNLKAGETDYLANDGSKKLLIGEDKVTFKLNVTDKGVLAMFGKNEFSLCFNASDSINSNMFRFYQKTSFSATIIPVNIYLSKTNEGKVTTKAPTCTEAGTEADKCAKCSELFNETPIPATGHTETTVTDTEPVCGVSGAGHKECSVCHENLGTYEIDALQHTSDEGTITTEATCTTEGVKTYKCTLCHEVLRTEPVEALGHSKSETMTIVTPATCSEKGTGEYRCSTCNEVMETVEIPTVAHKKSDTLTILTPATCTEAGSGEYRCTECGLSMGTVEIPAGAHEWELKETAANGDKTYECSICHETKEEKAPACEQHKTSLTKVTSVDDIKFGQRYFIIAKDDEKNKSMLNYASSMKDKCTSKEINLDNFDIEDESCSFFFGDAGSGKMSLRGANNTYIGFNSGKISGSTKAVAYDVSIEEGVLTIASGKYSLAYNTQNTSFRFYNSTFDTKRSVCLYTFSDVSYEDGGVYYNCDLCHEMLDGDQF